MVPHDLINIHVFVLLEIYLVHAFHSLHCHITLTKTMALNIKERSTMSSRKCLLYCLSITVTSSRLCMTYDINMTWWMLYFIFFVLVLLRLHCKSGSAISDVLFYEMPKFRPQKQPSVTRVEYLGSERLVSTMNIEN